MVTIRVPGMRPLGRWMHTHRTQILLYGGGGLAALMMLVQLLYPTDRLLPLAHVDGMNLGWRTKADAAKVLNTAYDDYKVPIYMGTDTKLTVMPTLKQASIKVDNTARTQQLDYPWYWRIVPTSLFWAHLIGIGKVPSPSFGSEFASYVDQTLMPECRREPVNATLKANTTSLEVVPAQDGGSCERDSVVKTLKAVVPNLTTHYVVRVAQQRIAPAVTDETATQLAHELKDRMGNGTTLMVNGAPQAITAQEIYSWLDFAADGSTLVATINIDRAGAWLGSNVAAKVAVAAGTSYIKTLDFTELSRSDGASGRALNTGATVEQLQQVVDGKADTASAVTQTVPPNEVYTRTYSATDAGLNALLANYAHDHPGTFGVSFIELDGKKRRAEYQADKIFVTASTYKLFAAYELLKQIDAGKRSWDAEATCFNKMISYSDNTCAEAYLDSLGLSTISKDIQAIGLKNSTFMKSGGPFTTANDLTLLLGMLQSQQNFSAVNRDRLINAMKANVYRKGIPAGVNGTVADKVGFMDALLHDAAIVYGPKGTYVLAIMTEGSSWATIADFAKQIDQLHSQ